jgi:hypothetical protein
VVGVFLVLTFAIWSLVFIRILSVHN